MRKIFNRMAVGAMAAAMALSAPVAAMADNAHFTYTNLEEEQPDLYVSKTVSSALDGYSAPEGTEFTFVLKWDQDGDGYLEFADSVSYFVYTANGTQVKNENTSDGSFKTSSTGRFTLRDGQYARFEWAGQVEYEITELAADGYTQTCPSGGEAATGTIPAEGVMVEFSNLYVPTTGTNSEETMLVIRKDAAWPDGYDAPEDLGAEFGFEVKIDGELYANEPYTVYDPSMTCEIGTGRTESDGTFTMEGNTAVCFDGVEVGVDYEITEMNDTEGWQAVGNTFYGGSTTSPVTYAYFTNEPTCFIVEKERSDGITGLDEEFAFTLTQSNGSPIAGASYYVYEDGKLACDEALETDGNGRFTLKAGEQALFTGIAEGTAYIVTETVPDGYSGMDSQSGTAEYDGSTNLFVNEQLTGITIRKTDGKDTLLGGAEFTLYRLKDGADPDSGDDGWEPYPDGDSAAKATSSEEGDGLGTLTFEGLPAGTYRIVETKTPAGYTKCGEDIVVTLPYSMTGSEVSASKTDTESEDFKGIYKESEDAYYFYSLAYEVSNTAVLMMPSTGGYAWVAWLVAGIGAAAVVAGAFLRKRALRPARSAEALKAETGKEK